MEPNLTQTCKNSQIKTNRILAMLTFFRKTTNSLAAHSLLVGLSTFISRITGFIRDLIAANLFGATIGYDAFILAFRIPNLMRRLFAEGAFSQAFVPVFAEYTQKKSPAEIKSFINKITGNLTWILVIVAIIGIIAAPIIVKLFAPGFYFNQLKDISNFDLVQFNTTVAMLRIVFPYILFISLTALATGILNCYNCFSAPAFTPVWLNISLILSSLILSKYITPAEFSLAIGVLIAGIVQLGFQLPFLAKLKLLPTLTIDWQDPGVKRILLLMLPACLSAAIGQINILVDSIFGSFFQTGSITWLYYADRLMEFPLGIFGGAFATVILPKMSKNFANKQFQDLNKTLTWGVQATILFGAPASIGLLLIATPLVGTLFFSGKFSANDVIMCSRALQGYAFSALGIMLAKIFANGFYAIGDLKTPLKIGVRILLANIVLNFVLTKFLGLAHTGIAIATSIVSILHATLLYFSLKQQNITLMNEGNKILLKITLACVILVLFLSFYPSVHINWLEAARSTKLLKLTEICCLAMIVYFGTLRLLGLKWKNILIGGNNQ